MNALLLVLLCVVVTMLFGCGNETHVVQQVAAQRTDLWFAYFGVVAEQIRETAAHVNAAFVLGWDEPSWKTHEGRIATGERVIKMCQQAIDAGIKQLIVGVDFLLFEPMGSGLYRYRNSAGIEELRAFVDQLNLLDLWQYVIALYPMDEPDNDHGIDDATMTQCNNALRLFRKPVYVNYTDRHLWPGLATCDWASFDKYEAGVDGNGLLDELKGRLGPSQRIVLVTGGADPWKNPIAPVLDRANREPQVVGIVAFLYDRGDPKQPLGIRDNGMAEQYAAAGMAIKSA